MKIEFPDITLGNGDSISFTVEEHYDENGSLLGRNLVAPESRMIEEKTEEGQMMCKVPASNPSAKNGDGE